MMLAVENSLTSAGDAGAPCSTLVGKIPGERCGNHPVFLPAPMDGGAWRAKLMGLQKESGAARSASLVPQMRCLPDHVLYTYLCFYIKPV